MMHEEKPKLKSPAPSLEYSSLKASIAIFDEQIAAGDP